MHIALFAPLQDPPGGGATFNAGLFPALEALGHTVSRHGPEDALPPGAVPVIDGLLLPDLETRLGELLPADPVVIVHHVSAKAGRDAGARAAVRAVEQGMLPRIRRVVATSAPVVERLQADFAIATPLLLQPGLPDLVRTPQPEDPACAILSLGVLTPRKGHDRLLTALARLTDLDWTLTIAGDAQRDPVHARSLFAQVETLGLGSRVTIVPDPDDAALEAEWARAGLFALATSWEGWPAGVAEALRRGIPVVAPRIPTIEALVPQTAGITYPPDDAATFGKCLRRGLFDQALRRALAEGAWQAGLALPGWPQQALAFQSILET